MASPLEQKEQTSQEISIPVLPDYEMQLLTAMAFFLGRKVNQQAAAVVAMYLRQSHDRILTQVEFYAQRLGMSKWELLNLISQDSDRAREILDSVGKVHDQEPDVFGGLE
jgi:hypothetical protein